LLHNGLADKTNTEPGLVKTVQYFNKALRTYLLTYLPA